MKEDEIEHVCTVLLAHLRRESWLDIVSHSGPRRAVVAPAILFWRHEIFIHKKANGSGFSRVVDLS